MTESCVDCRSSFYPNCNFCAYNYNSIPPINEEDEEVVTDD